MMKRVTIWMVVGLVALLALTGCGLLQEPEEASGPLAAVPVQIDEELAAPEVAEPDVEPTAVAEAVEEAIELEPVEEMDEEPAAVEEEPAAVDSPGLIVYGIDPGSSQVSFVLDEDLRGIRTTVTGVNDQVAAELALDLNDLSTAQLGTLLINARGFATDNNFRNRAIQNEILETAIYEFITFEPTAIQGLPDNAAPGDTVEFAISGDLTIRDVTLPVTFDVEAQVVTPDQISGTASTVINRNDFQLTIPAVQNVANVEEEVELYIQFVANATS